MRAGSRRAATRAASRRASSSAGSRPRKRSARSGEQVRAGPAVLRQRRLGDPVHDPAALVVQLDGRAHGRRLALTVDELVARRLGDEQAMSGLGGHARRVYRRTLYGGKTTRTTVPPSLPESTLIRPLSERARSASSS